MGLKLVLGALAGRIATLEERERERKCYGFCWAEKMLPNMGMMSTRRRSKDGERSGTRDVRTSRREVESRVLVEGCMLEWVLEYVLLLLLLLLLSRVVLVCGFYKQDERAG